MKKIIFSIGKLFALLYPYSVTTKLKRMYSRFYTGWLSVQFNSFGHNSVIIESMNCLKGGKYITIGDETKIGKLSVITAWDNYKGEQFTPQILIGNNVDIGDYCHITAINKIKIGDGVLSGRWLTITDNSHGQTDINSLLYPPSDRRLYSAGAVIIDDNVWMGDKVTILPNVHIGKNAIIAANSVVTKNVPENCVVAGVPAKVVKMMNNRTVYHEKP
jgi:acetyltransferase-like isoleucine patch superfamily enzyme